MGAKRTRIVSITTRPLPLLILTEKARQEQFTGLASVEQSAERWELFLKGPTVP
jgi:hypothetical protein